jgi:hypothetical protein
LKARLRISRNTPKIHSSYKKANAFGVFSILMFPIFMEISPQAVHKDPVAEQISGNAKLRNT